METAAQEYSETLKELGALNKKIAQTRKLAKTQKTKLTSMLEGSETKTLVAGSLKFTLEEKLELVVVE